MYRIVDSVAVTSGMTDSTGQYQIASPKGGSYQLKTFFVGYKPASTTLLVGPNQLLDPDTLLITPDTRVLSEVRVTGQHAELTVKADRQSYQANYIQEQDMVLINISYPLRQLSKKAKLPSNEFSDKGF